MKAWRESASLIIAARNGTKLNQTYDFSLLFLKRPAAAKFSGAYVFPGGVIELADADLKWHNIYKNHGFNENKFQSLFPNSDNNRPEIFHSKANELPREISLRISAIRETFEECGILICEKDCKISDKASNFPIPNGQLEFWQKKIHHNANEFYIMCEKLQCYPNLWALHEWSNWLTPTNFRHRFNTAFFFACLPQIPDIKLDSNEIKEFLWATPDHVKNSLIDFLPPPQQYEIAKVARHENLNNLLEYALKKSKQGIHLHFFIRVALSDGMVWLLPGDSMYPEKVDLCKDEEIDKSHMTIKQYRDISAVKRRVEFSNDTGSTTVNILDSKL